MEVALSNPRVKLEEPILSQSMLEADTVVENDEDPDDPVVREIDVFVSTDCAPQMHLIQYPLHHNPISLPKEARIRTKYGTMLELDQYLPNNIGRDGNYYLPHRTYVSHTIPVSTHLALGKIQKDPNNGSESMHLVPLEHILQMRPSFAHVDEEMANMGMSSASEQQEEGAAAKAADRKPLMFQKKESERATLARQSSYAYKKSCEDSEEWRKLQVLGPDSAQYRRANQGVTRSSRNSEAVRSVGVIPKDNAAYIDSLNYLPASERGKTNGRGAANSAPAVTTLVDNDKDDNDESKTQKNLVEATKTLVDLLYRGWPMPYGILRPEFDEGQVDDQDLLTALMSCAVLVRGNFVIQSKYLNFPHPAIGKARTFILYLINSYGHVQRGRLERVLREDGDDEVVTSGWIETILQQLARRVRDGWVLKLEDNSLFIARFPDQAEIYQQYWDRQAVRFKRQIKCYLQDEESNSDSMD